MPAGATIGASSRSRVRRNGPGLTIVPDQSELRLGTRGSQLALWQANAVAARIAARRRPAAAASSSSRPPAIGCRTRRCPRSAASGCSSRRSKTRCCAARSIWPCTAARTCRRVLPDGLAIGGVLPREDPRDAVVLPAVGRGSARAPASADVDDARGRRSGQSPSIGTSSVRRIAQLTRLFPGARFMPIRGNLDTRLRKLDAGEYDALVLAAAACAGSGSPSRISFDAAGRPPACRRRARASSPSRSARTTTRGRARLVARIDDPTAARGARRRAGAGRSARRRMPDAGRRAGVDRSTATSSSSSPRSSSLDGSRAVAAHGARAAGRGRGPRRARRARSSLARGRRRDPRGGADARAGSGRRGIQP